MSTLEPMVLGGAVEGGGEWLAVLLAAAVVMVVLPLTGGVVAWLIARRWEAFVLGVIAHAMAAWWIRPWVGGEAAALGGWLASATVGVLLTLAAPDLPEDGLARRNAPLPVVVVGLLSAAGCLALLWWSENQHDRVTASLSTAGSEPAAVACADPAPMDDDGCLSWEEQRASNLRHAERLPFEGDPVAAEQVAGEIRNALGMLAVTTSEPTEEQLHAALVPWGADGDPLQVSTKAVRTAGTAFALPLPGGCVFGNVHDGQATVEVGGYVNDGGCLASYGH